MKAEKFWLKLSDKKELTCPLDERLIQLWWSVMEVAQQNSKVIFFSFCLILAEKSFNLNFLRIKEKENLSLLVSSTTEKKEELVYNKYRMGMPQGRKWNFPGWMDFFSSWCQDYICFQISWFSNHIKLNWTKLNMKRAEIG